MTTLKQNRLEKPIQKIWCDVLNMENVGRDDNFFDLGGHSILLGIVQDKINKKLQQNLTLMDMFVNPTVQALAEYILNKSTEQHYE